MSALTVGVLPGGIPSPGMERGVGRGLGAIGPWMLISIRSFSASSGFRALWKERETLQSDSFTLVGTQVSL